MNRLRKNWREMQKYLLVVAAGIVFYELMEHFSAVAKAVSAAARVLTPIFLGLIIAYIVNIPAALLQKHLFKSEKFKNKRFVRPVCLTAGYVLVLGAITLLLCLVVPRVVDSVKLLFGNMDSYYRSLSDWTAGFLQSLDLDEATTERVLETAETVIKAIEDFAYSLVLRLPNYTINVVGVLADILLSFVFSIYALADKERLLARARRLTRAVFPERVSERILDTCSFANRTFRGYISGQLTSCTIIGILCYIGMRLFGMPFPEMISVFIGVFAMIPILGPWLSTVPSAFIILMSSPGDPMLAVWFVVMVLVIQQIDNNFIYPRVVGDAVGLSSAWVLAAIIIGGGLLGLRGLLFAVPAMAVIYRVIGDWTNSRARAKGVPLVDTVPESDFDFRGHRKSRRRRRKAEPRASEEAAKAEKRGAAGENGGNGGGRAD